jgi:hypothetical protein
MGPASVTVGIVLVILACELIAGGGVKLAQAVIRHHQIKVMAATLLVATEMGDNSDGRRLARGYQAV